MKHMIALCATLVALAAPAQARITELVIDKVEPFADGMAFGAAGAYERVIGTAKGELDPADPRNRGIVNLDKAPRNARGMVEYDTDVFILRPADAERGSHKLLYEVNNRGRKFLTHWLMDAPPANANDPRSAEDAGDALLFRLGFTMVWSGWDPDAPRANNGMAMHVPLAQENGRPIVRAVRDELVSGTRAPEVAAFKLSDAAASLDTAKARLTLRAKEAEPAQAIPADGWAFVDERTIKLLSDGTKPAPGALYELTYEAKDPKVLGIGFAAYAGYLWKGLTRTESLALIAAVGVVNIALLYRRIGSIATVTVTLWLGTLVTVLAVIVAYVVHRRTIRMASALAFVATAPLAVPGIVLAVGFNRRFHPSMHLLRQAVISGRLGTLVTISAEQTALHGITMAPDAWRASATEAPARNRFKRMEAAWRALAEEEHWLDGEVPPVRSNGDARKPPPM